ncbi:MAG: peptidoglycan editing factor PgeF [Prevotella sp.]|nr:peptidoglycan editing factor PgeF [Prevotella sp.]
MTDDMPNSDHPTLLHYDLGNGVTAFSSTRKGGVSQGNYAEFNINHYCGDDEQAIAANCFALCHLLGIDSNHLAYPHQVHGTEVRQIGVNWPSLSEQERAQMLEGVDAVMTDTAGVCIGVSTADCIPILLYDAEHHACAAIHAGWRGTVARIAEKAVEAMTLSYHTDASQLKAVIGPGISLESFEVGDEVYESFSAAGFDMERIAHRYAKWHIDLWEANRLSLIKMGVGADAIQISGICTYTHADRFFSARRLGINSGRIFTGIILNVLDEVR